MSSLAATGEDRMDSPKATIFDLSNGLLRDPI